MVTYPGPVVYYQGSYAPQFYNATNTPPTLVKFKVKTGRS